MHTSGKHGILLLRRAETARSVFILVELLGKWSPLISFFGLELGLKVLSMADNLSITLQGSTVRGKCYEDDTHYFVESRDPSCELSSGMRFDPNAFKLHSMGYSSCMHSMVKLKHWAAADVGGNVRLNTEVLELTFW